MAYFLIKENRLIEKNDQIDMEIIHKTCYAIGQM